MAGKNVSIQDRSAATDLLARYCFYVDEGMTEEWLDLWEEDGVFFGTRSAPVVGHEALRASPEGSLAGGMRHYLCNVFLDYADSEDEITAIGYNLILSWKNSPAIFANAVVRYTLVRRGDRWKIKSNQVRLQVPHGYPEQALPEGFPLPNDQRTRWPEI